MRLLVRLVLAATIASALTIVAAVGNENAPGAAAIQALIANYAAGVNAEPIDMKLLSAVWDHSPDDSLVNPESYERGWEQIKRNFYEKTMEALFAERKLTIHDINLHVYGDSAWAEFQWHFAAKSRQGGAAVQANGMETQIYRKAAGNRWVLVHVHYSRLPR